MISRPYSSHTDGDIDPRPSRGDQPWSNSIQEIYDQLLGVTSCLAVTNYQVLARSLVVTGYEVMTSSEIVTRHIVTNCHVVTICQAVTK